MSDIKKFNTRLEAIDYIATVATDEGAFEVLRERLNFNYIYTGEYFVDFDKPTGVVDLTDNSDRLN